MTAAKGFKPKRTLLKLNFDGGDLAGLEVIARGTTVAGLLELAELGDKLGALKELDERADASKVAARVREMFAPFARLLVSWNVLDDDDEPVPASIEGLLSQELDFVGELITRYVTAAGQARPGLGKDSGSGGSSQEELTAAAALSSALPS